MGTAPGDIQLRNPGEFPTGSGALQSLWKNNRELSRWRQKASQTLLLNPSMESCFAMELQCITRRIARPVNDLHHITILKGARSLHDRRQQGGDISLWHFDPVHDVHQPSRFARQA
jgi:hypothetical protein